MAVLGILLLVGKIIVSYLPHYRGVILTEFVGNYIHRKESIYIIKEVNYSYLAGLIFKEAKNEQYSCN